MSLKNQKTVCSAIDWRDFLLLLDKLKRKEKYQMLLLIATGGYMGLRISDIRLLRWKHLTEAPTIEICEKKTGKLRLITINPVLQDLANYVFDKLCKRKDDYIFCNRQGNPLSIQYINRKLHEIFFQNNIKLSKNNSSHCLRKSFALRVWESNNRSEASLLMLSTIFRHSSLSTTRLYLGIRDEEIANIYLNI